MVTIGVPLYGGEIVDTIYINEDISFTGMDGYLVPAMDGGVLWGKEEGFPILLTKNVSYVIPVGASNVNVEIVEVEKDTLNEEGLIYPWVPIDTFYTNESAYSSESVYPSNEVINIYDGYKNGWHVVNVSLNVLDYISGSRRIIRNKTIIYKITYDEMGTLSEGITSEVPSNMMSEIANEIKDIVLNPEDVDVYAPSVVEVDDEDRVDFVIIVPSEWKNIVEPVARWKTKRGLRTRVVTVDSIESVIVRGYDTAEKIKGFIKRAYLYNGTRYFLFFGSDDGNLDCWEYDGNTLDEAPGVFVPAREALIGRSGDNGYSPYRLYKPDLYYAGLDGYWDWDQDGIFGEVEDERDIDLYPEVIVGRVLAESEEDAENYVRKIMIHEKAYPQRIEHNILLYDGIEDWQSGYTLGLLETEEAENKLNSIGNVIKFLPDIPNQADTLVAYMNKGISYIFGIAHGSPIGVALNGPDFTIDYGIQDLVNENNLCGIYIGESCEPAFYKLNSFAENILCRSGDSTNTVSGVSAIIIPYNISYFGDYVMLRLADALGSLKANTRVTYVGGIINYHWSSMVYNLRQKSNLNLYGDPTLPLYFEGPYEMVMGMYDRGNGELEVCLRDKETYDLIGNSTICLIVINSNTGDTLYYESRDVSISDVIFDTGVNFTDEGIKTYVVGTAKNYYPAEDSLIGKGYKDLMIVWSDKGEIQIMKNDSVSVLVKGMDISTGEVKPLSMAKVIVSNGLGFDNYRFYREFYTDENGYAKIYIGDSDIRSTHQIEIRVEKAGYEDGVRYINPYMWTSDAEAFGTNSQHRMELYIDGDTREWWLTYSDGQYINAAYSGDVDGPWKVIRVAKGKNPDMVAIPGGLFGIWTTGIGLGYAIKHSPWTPNDTLYPEVFVYQEPVMSISPETDSLYLGYLYLTYHNPVSEGFNYGFHHLWVEEDTLHDVDSEVVVPEEGDVWFNEIKVNHSPVVAMFESYDRYIPAVGFIDSRNRFTIKMRDVSNVQNTWTVPRQPGDTTNIAMHPFAIGFGNSMHFMWEEYDPTINRTYLLRYKIDTSGEDLDTIRYGSLSYIRSPSSEFFEYVNRGDNGIHLLIPTNTGHADVICYDGSDSIYYPDIKVFFDPYDTTGNGVYYGGIMFAERYGGVYKIVTKSIEYGGVGQAFYYKEYVYSSEGTKGNADEVNIEEHVKGLNRERNYYLKVGIEGDIKGSYKVYIDGVKYGVLNHHRRDLFIDIGEDLYTLDREIDIEIKGRHSIEGKVKIGVYEYLPRDGVKGRIGDVYMIKGDNFVYIKNDVKDELYTIRRGNKIHLYYGVEESGDISLVLYDISGRKVKDIYKGYRDRGYYEEEINSSEVPSGVYMLVYTRGDKVIKAKIANVR